MGDVDLQIRMILEHGRDVFGDSEVVTFTGEGVRRASFREVAARAAQLAHALAALGVRAGDRVGTLLFNGQEHEEAYFAVPCMGAVLHTLNFRLHPDQLAWIANHAEDRVILCEGFLVPQLLPIVDLLPLLRHVVVVGDRMAGVRVTDRLPTHGLSVAECCGALGCGNVLHERHNR
jgi:fatty-acyl-CoA synthase